MVSYTSHRDRLRMIGAGRYTGASGENRCFYCRPSHHLIPTCLYCLSTKGDCCARVEIIRGKRDLTDRRATDANALVWLDNEVDLEGEEEGPLAEAQFRCRDFFLVAYDPKGEGCGRQRRRRARETAQTAVKSRRQHKPRISF